MPVPGSREQKALQGSSGEPRMHPRVTEIRGREPGPVPGTSREPRCRMWHLARQEPSHCTQLGDSWLYGNQLRKWPFRGFIHVHLLFIPGSALPRAGDVFESKLEPNAPTPQLLLKPSHQCPDLENHSSLLLSPTPSSVSLRRDPASPASASSQLLSPPRANPRSGSGHALLCRRHPRPGTGQMLSQPVSSSTAL